MHREFVAPRKTDGLITNRLEKLKIVRLGQLTRILRQNRYCREPLAMRKNAFERVLCILLRLFQRLKRIRTVREMQRGGRDIKGLQIAQVFVQELSEITFC